MRGAGSSKLMWALSYPCTTNVSLTWCQYRWSISLRFFLRWNKLSSRFGFQEVWDFSIAIDSFPVGIRKYRILIPFGPDFRDLGTPTWYWMYFSARLRHLRKPPPNFNYVHIWFRSFSCFMFLAATGGGNWLPDRCCVGDHTQEQSASENMWL